MSILICAGVEPFLVCTSVKCHSGTVQFVQKISIFYIYVRGLVDATQVKGNTHNSTLIQKVVISVSNISRYMWAKSTRSCGYWTVAQLHKINAYRLKGHEHICSPHAYDSFSPVYSLTKLNISIQENLILVGARP